MAVILFSIPSLLLAAAKAQAEIPQERLAVLAVVAAATMAHRKQVAQETLRPQAHRKVAMVDQAQAMVAALSLVAVAAVVRRLLDQMRREHHQEVQAALERLVPSLAQA